MQIRDSNLKVGDFHQGPSGELLVRCNCGDSHFLNFTYYHVDDVNEVFVEVNDTWRRPRGVIDRIKAAWDLFWHAEFHVSGVGLNKKDLEDIHSWTGQFLDR